MTTECSAHHFQRPRTWPHLCHLRRLCSSELGHEAQLQPDISSDFIASPRGPSQLALWPWSSSTHKANTQMINSHDPPTKKVHNNVTVCIIEDRLIHKHQHFDWLPGMPLWNLRLSPERQVREVRGVAESHLSYPRARDKARAQNSHLCTMCGPKALGLHNSTGEIKMQNGKFYMTQLGVCSLKNALTCPSTFTLSEYYWILSHYVLYS